jgi:hypothetical protein
MIKVFKEKAPTLQAVEVTDVLNQLPEVANLIGATQAGVSITSEGRVGNFKLDGQDDSYQVKEGQVIALSNGEITVLDAAEFYSKYEAI